MTLGPLISSFDSRNLSILAHHPNKYLTELDKLTSEKELKPVIDGIYPLEQIQPAMRRIARGDVRGKVILKITGS